MAFPPRSKNGRMYSPQVWFGGAWKRLYAWGAGDGAAVQLCGDHAADEAGEGVELVETGAPEAGHLGLGDGDAAEE
ncbi:hypothetical protein Aspvir_004187 [Aspergillus viridinutans]|uniref:Uncharacterized protein n=1 Tax=Aspergillus viridinutans TaxID=75553 RepID=A0A9P3BVF5_ASPVI|nr:uncharacterized protein Aspvir_004187 [Aspergillus viridinutans]GIK00167.1 hypothetical protein Aspvir_004187 [Aspergillus viridinutans]